MKSFYKNLFLCLLLMSLCSCGKEKDIKEINPDIVNLTEQVGSKGYLDNVPNAIWLNDSTLCIGRNLSIITIDKDFQVKQLMKQIENEGGEFLSLNPLKNKILYGEILSQSESIIKEYNIHTGNIDVVLEEKDKNIFGACYYKEDNVIIYCTNDIIDSASNPYLLGLGYYFYNRQTKEKTHILQTDEHSGFLMLKVNGFDIHPLENKLLVPINTNKKGIPSLLVEYNLDSKISDTLKTSFNGNITWYRYNKTGTKILYSTFDGGFKSEIGILDKATMTKKILNTNTNRYKEGTSLDVYPDWSPNEKNIIYGSAIISSESGDIGSFKLCILKNIN